MTYGLEGRCSIHLSYGQRGRGERIRTSDILLPKQALHRTELHPDSARVYPLDGTVKAAP